MEMVNEEEDEEEGDRDEDEEEDIEYKQSKIAEKIGHVTFKQ